jgi:ABC-type phosphate transport system substrate-binding protein
MRKSLQLSALLMALALVVAACGGDDTGADGTDAPATTGAMTDDTEALTDDTGAMADEMSDLGLPVIDPLDADSGDVAIAGSSTVFPLSTAVLSLWQDEGGPEYTIDSIGSGGGFERFCVEGASDISNASRPINDEEIAACGEIGRDPIEIRVGTDALTLVVSPGNYFAAELTIDQIAAAYALTDPNATWADVDPSFPAHPIQLFSPGEDSGTFDYFNEVIFEEADPSPIVS